MCPYTHLYTHTLKLSSTFDSHSCHIWVLNRGCIPLLRSANGSFGLKIVCVRCVLLQSVEASVLDLQMIF